MDRYLGSIVLLVLLICSLFLLDDLKVIELPFFKRTTQSDRELVGHISIINNQVKRRSHDEFLWSGTRRNEEIYFYDSILTLSESQVRLELLGKSKIDLSENTLIVIEPSLAGSRDEIRLKFKRGSLKSKDLSQATQILAGEWELKLDTGTDFHLRSKDNDTFELEVQKGSARVISDGQEKTIAADEALILKPKSLEKIDLNTTLDWKEPSFKRIYTRDEHSSVKLQWSGEAKSLIHTIKNKADEALPLSHNEGSHDVELSIGTHFFRLRDDKSSSKLLTVELSRAPSLHLHYPLPRDRIEIGKTLTFTWRKLATIPKYRLEIGDDPDFKTTIKTYETSKNFQEYKPETLGKFYWRVVGIDNDGFEILPAYSNEILFIENPLGAPGIETPERKPSEQNTNWLPTRFWIYSLISLMTSIAQADEPKITFEWKKVKNADTYNLEIDDDPFFQSPEVITTTRNTYFQWSTKAKGIFYWRVAGDSKKGRLGLFSPVQKSDISNLRISRAPSSDFDVYIKDTTEVPTTSLPPPETSNYPPALIVEPPPKIEPLSETQGYFGYAAGFGHYQFKTKDIDRVTLSGLQAVNIIGDYNFHSENYSIKIKSDVSYSQWKPDKTKLPFQEEQETLTGSIAALHTSRARELWFGVKVSQLFEPHRLGLEKMELQTLYLFGPTVQFDSLINETVFNHLSSSVLVGSSSYYIDLDNLVRKRLFIYEHSALSLGFRTNIFVLSLKEADGMSYAGQAQLVIGFDW